MIELDNGTPCLPTERAAHKQVSRIDFLDSRWNGNEVYKFSTDAGDFFVKMNRVQSVAIPPDPLSCCILDASLRRAYVDGDAPCQVDMFNSELASLTALGSTGTIKVAVPLHVGTLPKIGTIGPGTKPALANTKAPG